MFLVFPYAYGAPLSLLPVPLKTAFCADLLGVETDIEKLAPLNPQAITEILTRVYPDLPAIDGDGQTIFPSAHLYSASTQDFLHLLHKAMGRSYRKILAVFFAPQPYGNNPGLRKYFETDGANVSAKTLAGSEPLIQHYGIVQTGSSLHLPERIQVELLNEVLREIRKTPVHMRQVIERVGKHLDVVTGSVTDHPNLGHLRGVRPRGWPKGRTWDSVPGLSDSEFREGTVVAADRLTKGHGSINLILHEHAHTFDKAASELSGQPALSARSDFLAIHAKIKWSGEYFQDYPEEAFAESLARYLHSTRSRKELREQYAEVYEYFARIF